MVNRFHGIRNRRQDKAGDAGQLAAVELRQRAAFGVLGGQFGQEDIEEGGLQFVEPGIDAGLAAQVMRPPAVLAHAADTFGKGVVGGDDAAAVAHRAEILGRIKAERPRRCPVDPAGRPL